MIVVFLLRFVGLLLVLGFLGWLAYRFLKSDKKEELEEALEEKKMQEELNATATEGFKGSNKVIKASQRREEEVDKFLG